MGRRILFVLLCLLCANYGYGQEAHFTVALDGSGDFKTVQEAVNAVPDFRKTTTIIFIKNGLYKEKINISASKRKIRLLGESLEGTILSYDDFAQKKNRFGEEMGTSGSASCYIYGDEFSASNLTFQNTAGPIGQAVAVWIAADQAVFVNCRFLGYQDTLYTYGHGARQYYKDCFIEGTTDFIFGSSTAVFEDCRIFCKPGGSYITAASTPDTSAYGYVFKKCKVTGSAPVRSYFLGRPWRPYAKTVFIACELDEIVKPAGWDHWGKETNKRTAYYAEYQNKGSGYLPAERVGWSKQLSEEEAKSYRLDKVFRGWIPKY